MKGTKRLLVSTVLVSLTSAVAYACWADDDRTPMDPEMGAAVMPVLGAGQPLASPLRLAAEPSGLLLVSDPQLGRVMAFDPATLQSYEAFAVDGQPLSVGILGRQILVGSASERSLQYYDVRGRLRRSTGKGSVGRPSDIAVDETEGLAFVVDAGAGNIKVFDDRARLVATLSSQGTGPGQLMAPVGIAVDPATRRIFVSDWGDFGSATAGTASIKIFTYDGAFVDLISGRGRCGSLGCSGGFSRPQGMQLDSSGRIYLADAMLAQVLVIDPATKQVTGYLGGRPMFRLPTDVVLIGGDIFVVSNRTASIEVLRGGVQP